MKCEWGRREEGPRARAREGRSYLLLRLPGGRPNLGLLEVLVPIGAIDLGLLRDASRLIPDEHQPRGEADEGRSQGQPGYQGGPPAFAHTAARLLSPVSVLTAAAVPHTPPGPVFHGKASTASACSSPRSRLSRRRECQWVSRLRGPRARTG
jgi:hypothetical protein